MPPKKASSSGKRNSEYDDENQLDTANTQSPRRDSRIPPRHPSPKLPKALRKPSLKRSGSRLGQYAHIGPKIDSKLDPKFIPGESQFQRPKHKRNSMYINTDWQAHDEGSEDAGTGIKSDSSIVQDKPTQHHYNPDQTVATDSPTWSVDSADIYAHFGGGGGDPTSAAPSPSHTNNNNNSEIAMPSSQNSRSSSRRPTLEHPTSNPAAYARNTGSYKGKMNDRLEYSPIAPSSPAWHSSPRRRDPPLDTRTTRPLPSPEWNQKRFDGPPPTSPSVPGHDRLRTRSLVTKSSLRSVAAERMRDALDATGRDLVSLRDGLRSGRRVLSFGAVLREDGEMPGGVNGVRRRIVEVLACYERRVGELEGVCGGLERERDEVVERRVEEVEVVEEKVKELETREAGYESKIDGQRRRIEGLEGIVRRKGEEEAARDREIEAACEKQQGRIMELEEICKSNEAQASRVRQLEAELQSRPVLSVSQSQMQEAFRLHEQQAQEIRRLEEALQVKQVNHALATGTDTPEWHALFKRERKIRAAQEHEITHLKTSITKLDAYHVDLEREVEALKEYVTTHRDTVQTLQDQLAASTIQAKQWRAEYQQQKDMLDQRTVAEEIALQETREEMQRTISAYQKLLPTRDHPDALEITGLSRQLEAQGKALTEVTQRLEVLKQEKGALEKGIERVLDEKKVLVREIEELRCGPPPPPRVILDEETNEVIRLPEWNNAERVIQRGVAMDEFRRGQEAVRKREETKARLVEKARGWKMGRHYPPSRGDYKSLLNKSEWERWDVKMWAEEQATDSEYDEIQRLGLLDERKNKGRRTNDWKGKGWGSMGLRSWDV